MYRILVIISVLIRNFVLPNPFSCFGSAGELYNILAEPVIHLLAYTLVGLVYERGSEPAWGSLLYLIVYSSVVLMLFLFGIFKFALWWVLLVIVGCPLILFLILKIIGFCVGKITSKKI